jgi:hypothetical protein
MHKVIREIPLDNGLTFLFSDATRRYFGDYHQVRIKISCDIIVRSDYFQDVPEHHAALQLLGEKVQYVKEVEHQGVATEAIAETIDRVIRHFVDHSLGYFDNSDFPKKFVHSELNRIRSKGKRFAKPPVHG